MPSWRLRIPSDARFGPGSLILKLGKKLTKKNTRELLGCLYILLLFVFNPFLMLLKDDMRPSSKEIDLFISLLLRVGTRILEQMRVEFASNVIHS